MRKPTVQIKTTTKEEIFISKYFPEGYVQEYRHSEFLALNNVIIRYYDMLLSDVQEGSEELALLRYTPYEDEEPYLSFIFIPECNNKSDEWQRAVQLVFQPAFFKNYSRALLLNNQPFKSDRTVEQAFTHNAFSREALDFISRFSQDESDIGLHIRLQEAVLQLLRYGINALYLPDEANYLPACSFLNNNKERDKILDAQKTILDNLDKPHTIRELARMVGINECYLKKGFKAMFGKSVHEYLQYERIEKAKVLLQQKNLTVNEVAFRLGFGSASHFSTSFKKIAGMKPCELLQ